MPWRAAALRIDGRLGLGSGRRWTSVLQLPVARPAGGVRAVTDQQQIRPGHA